MTVLVADVVGSTELFGKLGVDRADTARRALFTALSIAIDGADGVLIKTMGGGCLASFGSVARRGGPQSRSSKGLPRSVNGRCRDSVCD